MDEASSAFSCEAVETEPGQVNPFYYPEYRAAFIEMYGPLCSYCAKPVSLSPKDGELFATVDHIVPKVSGGSNAAGNLTVACSFCNTSKCNTPLAEFLAKKKLSPSVVKTFSEIDPSDFKSRASKRLAARWAGTSLITVKVDAKTRRILQRRADRELMCLATYVKWAVMREMDRRFGKGWEATSEATALAAAKKVKV